MCQSFATATVPVIAHVGTRFHGLPLVLIMPLYASCIRFRRLTRRRRVVVDTPRQCYLLLEACPEDDSVVRQVVASRSSPAWLGPSMGSSAGDVPDCADTDREMGVDDFSAFTLDRLSLALLSTCASNSPGLAFRPEDASCARAR